MVRPTQPAESSTHPAGAKPQPYEPPMIRALGSAKDLLAAGGTSCTEVTQDPGSRSSGLC